MAGYLFGRECEVGWGYNSLTGEFTPVEGGQIYSLSRDNFSQFEFLSNIACDNLPTLVSVRISITPEIGILETRGISSKKM